MRPPKSTPKSQVLDPSWTLENCAFQCVRRERLFYLSSGHYDGHLTVVFARRPYGYFNVMAESGEEVNKAAYREVARAIAGQRRDMGLRNAEDFPSFGLGDTALLDDAVDL
jgi:hypothetical protein